MRPGSSRRGAARPRRGALAIRPTAHVDTAAPGMTHMQHAQPVSFGHLLLAHVQPLLRDVSRLRDWDKRAAISPVGRRRSGRLVASARPRADGARARLRPRSTANTIDAVSDRDFAAEFLFVAALVGVHLSRIGEEIVLWTTSEFGWVELDDAFATGSSIMPQKKNPDVAELARGKSGPADRLVVALLDHAEGSPARLRPGSAGGQGAGVRRGRHAGDRAAGAHRDHRDDDACAPTGSPRRRPPGSAWPPTSRSTWSARGSRSATRTRPSAIWSSGASRTTSDLHEVGRRRPRGDQPASDAGGARRALGARGAGGPVGARGHGAGSRVREQLAASRQRSRTDAPGLRA